MSETGAHDQPRDFALPLGAGIVQLFAGALMFAAGAAAAWSWTALACGAALVAGAWLISFDPSAEARQAVLIAAATRPCFSGSHSSISHTGPTISLVCCPATTETPATTE